MSYQSIIANIKQSGIYQSIFGKPKVMYFPTTSEQLKPALKPVSSQAPLTPMEKVLGANNPIQRIASVVGGQTVEQSRENQGFTGKQIVEGSMGTIGSMERVGTNVAKKVIENGAEKIIPKVSNEVKTVANEILKAPRLDNTPFYSVKKFITNLTNNEALKKYGDEGKQIFDKIKIAEKEAVINKSEAIVKMDKAFKGLSEDDFVKFGDYVEGKTQVPETAQEAVNTWKSIAGDIANKSKETNIQIKLPDGKKVPFNPREDYYPYFVREDFLKEVVKSPEEYNKFLEAAAQKSNTTPAKMHEIISDLINGRAGYEGHLERARTANLPMEVYERDPRKILSQYISNSYDRLSEAKQFGGDDKILQNLIEKARIGGQDFEEIQALTNRALGRERFNKDIQNVSNFARQYNNLTKLSLASITNLGDITKPFVRSGIVPTLKAVKQSFTGAGKELASKAGVIDPVLSQFAKEQGIGEKFFKLTGFQATETKLRQISANAAKNYVEVLYKKLVKNPDNVFIKRRLEQFGLDANELIKNGIKPSDYVEAAYQAIADTQPISKVDMPYYWQSPTGKVLTQYKQFAYKQMKFAKKFIYDEAKKGNVKPLLTFIVVGEAVGEGVGDLKAFVRGRKRPNDIGRRMIDNLTTIGGIGLASDFLSNLQYNSMGGNMLKFLVGPTLSDIDAWTTATQGDISTIFNPDKSFVVGKQVGKNETQPKVLKKVIGSVPFVGPAVSNALFPTRNDYQARTIPIAEELLQMTENNGIKKPNINKPAINKPKINKPMINKPQG